jgi:cytidylate kinase
MSETPVIVIAIDGPVAAGKGTLAQRLAEHLGLRHLDSGMIYRATAARLLASGGDPDDVAASEKAALSLQAEDLVRPNLRDQKIGGMASRIAVLQPVRDALLAFQRAFAAEKPGAVIDGRDIGTVVCPDADVKLYVTAGLEERANRRFEELVSRGESANLKDISNEIAERDRRDMERTVAPLRQADDAVLVDTSKLDADAAFEEAVEIVRKQLNAKGKTSI